MVVMWQRMFSMAVMRTVWRREPPHATHYNNNNNNNTYISSFLRISSAYCNSLYPADISNRIQYSAKVNFLLRDVPFHWTGYNLIKNNSLNKAEKSKLFQKAQTCNLHEILCGAGAVRFVKSGNGVLQTERSI